MPSATPIDDPHATARLALRPTVEATLSAEPTAANFLHRTLRPVLKLQHEHVLAAVADFLSDHHVPFLLAHRTEQQRLIGELLGRNTKLRYTIVGLITGQFTREEYTFYRAHRSELNRRILELAVQRAHDSTEAIAHYTTPAGP
ncbi:hypothetical protein [Hymenobacter mucosus]|uniref:Uncharacterized protein n=1 Tax=Hymenobacter mucosus TaxID=1411120 RepID=A0A238X968_9BACT|nr:hypothetical protein [Hymenobacter mucosus]SNR54904.1 hypothetical protein SAMN06269173_103572 [Hymenobacter mucosus]